MEALPQNKRSWRSSLRKQQWSGTTLWRTISVIYSDSKGSISTILFPAVRKPQLKTADHLSVCEASNRNEAYSMQRSSLIHKTFSLCGKQALPKIEQISQTIIVSRGFGDWQSYPSLFTPLEKMERDCCWFFHLYRLTSFLKINEYKNIKCVSGSHLLHWKPISISENSSWSIVCHLL